jgi:hypothetical protein
MKSHKLSLLEMRKLYPTIIQQKSSRHIGHLEDFVIGQVSNILPGQVTNLRRSARAIASARLETPSLDRMLLT